MKQKKTLFADILETVTKYFLILVVVVLIGVFLSGLRVVEEGNVAVVLRFGKLVGENDVTEIDLDDIQDWDYLIDNNKDYNFLKKRVLEIVEIIR